MRFGSILCMVLIATTLSSGPGHQPPEGFVPNSEAAIKIMEAVLIPVCGKEKMESERPFLAELKDRVWTVTGSNHCPGGKDCRDGGSATLKISKSDARILSLTFSR
jgi:hypothetical protein